MTEKNTNPLSQPLDNRESGADAAAALTQAVTCAAIAKTASLNAAASASANTASAVTSGCLQRITMAFFFDGTGNNLDADKGTGEQSNIARLFRAHPLDNKKTQTYSRYIPGIGTYFKEIHDPGGTATGRGMGAYGQERLNWSFRQLAKVLQDAEALANNPSNRIVGVRISVFGFSRGSALARAFCRDLQQKSAQGRRGNFTVRPGPMGTSGMMLKGGYPVEVYFLGIFDTVASVGLPLSANNTLFKRHDGVGWRDFVGAGAYGQAERDLKNLAFGMPGADPSPGPADGHGAWSDDLKVVDIVTQCVHMVSGHEMRNSFPLDSVLDSGRYPDGAIEMVYPGVHSDVGGGYRQGEGGKSALLAQMPLRLMLEKAIEAKVPLLPLTAARGEDEKKDFAIDEKSSKAYDNMLPLWKSYMAEVNKAKPLGAVVLDHMRVYWRYRITAAVLRSDPAHAGRSGRAGHARDLTPEQQLIQDNEKIFSANRAALQKEVDAKQSVFNEASARRSGAEEGLQGAQTSTAFDSQVPFWKAQVQTAKSDEDRAYDDLHSSQAKLTTAADDSALIKDMDYYDAWLLEDAKQISQWHKENPNLRMRPHYLAVVEAYEEVVIKHQLMDESSDIYKLFNLYVHDSLSGFRTDNTRTSDPRVIYIGGDVKYKYAMNTVQHDPQTAEA